MVVDPFSLISPEPFEIPYAGRVKAPSLREIAREGYVSYQSYLSLLSMDQEACFSMLSEEGRRLLSQYAKQEAKPLTSFDIFAFDKQLRAALCAALDFFLEEIPVFDEKTKVFLTYPPDFSKSSDGPPSPLGVITSENYPVVCDVILQRACIKKADKSLENGRVKNEAAARILRKLERGKNSRKPKEDKRMDLPNVISSLACHHKSLNLSNIWDLTVYQLYDQFHRQMIEDSYGIHSVNVAAYGNSGGKFDPSMWFSVI